MKYSDTLSPDFSDRPVAAGVDPVLARRWSPRAFKKTSLREEDVNLLFEAARCAPSCFNEQPWVFYISTEQTFDDYLALLAPGNQRWAHNASLLCFVVCHKNFSHNGRPNQHAVFDCGSAWMSLTYQARTMGLYTHGMGGIEYERVADYLNLSDNQSVICGIAIGVADTADHLPEELAKKEKPTPRKPLSEVLIRR